MVERTFLMVGITICMGVSLACGSAPISYELDDFELVTVPIVTIPKDLGEERFPAKGPDEGRIIITAIEGDCAQEVKDALMRRLTGNPSYQILSKDNLTQIIEEQEESWNTKFNSETAAKLGNLLAASRYIVGRVTYCGGSPLPDGSVDFRILANLQLLDLETRRVLLSASAEGRYKPVIAKRLKADEDDDDDVSDREREGDSVRKSWGNSAPSTFESLAISSQEKQIGKFKKWRRRRKAKKAAKKEEESDKKKAEPAYVLEYDKKNYPKIRAADDFANSFANRFFSRPSFRDVVMWRSPRWRHSDATQLVRLGQCPKAIEMIEVIASREVSFMSEGEIGRFLHNYGVVLLCAGEIDQAMRKLRSAYRIDPRDETKRMMGIASEVSEWEHRVEVVTEPEMRALVERKRLENP